MTAADKQAHLTRFHRFQKSREKHFAPLIFKAIRSQYDLVLTALRRGLTEREALNLIPSSPIIAVLKPLYIDAATVYGAKIRADLNKLIPTRLSFQSPLILKSKVSNLVHYKARMPMGFSESMRQLIEQYFSLDILNQSEGITDTTRELIRQVFTDAYQLGEGIDDIVKKLENTELSRMRSRLIARTETVTAANAGSLIVAKSTGLDLNKEWLAAKDNRTRRHHRHLDGQIVGLDDYFSDHGVTMKVPGARVQQNGTAVPASYTINCRCTTLFIPVDETRPQKVTPAVVIKPVFVPAETIEDANKFLKEKHGVFYQTSDKIELNLEAKNLINKRLDELLFEYKKEGLKNIGFVRDDNVYAQANTRSLQFNPTYWNDDNKLAGKIKGDIKTNWLFDGSATSSRLIDHEFAHVLTNQYLSDDAKDNLFRSEVILIQKEYARQMKEAGTKYKNDPDFISKYAHTNYKEFVAESFSMALNSDTPSSYAMQIKKLIDNYFKK